MDAILHNLEWMSFNIFLAILGVFFGWIFYYSKKKLFSIVFFILWVLFLPNTIYLVTDLQHIYKQFFIPTPEAQIILLIQYLLIVATGIITYILAMYPVDKIFTHYHLKKNHQLKITLLFFINVFVAFAVVLGKFQRTHSWYVFTDTLRVLSDMKTVLTTPILLMLVILFAVVINLTYFAFVKVIPVKIKSKKIDR